MSSNTNTGTRAPNRTRSSFLLTQLLLEVDVIPVIFVGWGPIRLCAESEDITLLTLKVLDAFVPDEGIWRGVTGAVSEVQVTGVGMDRELGTKFGHRDPCAATRREI